MTVPVTVLTGYLGAGKTTLLNRILTHEHGKKVAVIVNEFGEVGIDHQLVVNTDEEIFEMNNGCICCTVRGDLIRIIGNLMKRRHKFDHLVIETTGLADPAPVIQTFFMDEDIRSQTHLDAVITVVDAKHIHYHWQAEEAQEQIAFADVILVNKTDLVSEADLAQLRDRIHAMNPLAKVYHTQQAAVPMEHILDVGGFDLERALELDPDFLGEDHHEHDASVGSVAIVAEGKLNGAKLQTWLTHLLQSQGPDIFRMKGILHLAEQPQPFVFQGVHMLFDGRPLDRPLGHQRNELIFIGRNLNENQLRQAFRDCLV